MNYSTNISGRSAAIISFIALYLCAAQYCRWRYYRDPTSLFFDPQRGYAEGYSSVRRQEADTFIASASLSTYNKTMVSSSPTPKFCVGVISVARDNVRYFRTAVGSLLEGLTIEERQEIYLVLFIAHTDPTKHPAYSESWLTNVADKVLTYSLSEDQLEHINSLEQDRGSIREKALFDFTYLLKTCSAVGAPHIIMNEDDVIALDGWYHRTKKALEIAEEKTHLKGSSNCEKKNICFAIKKNVLADGFLNISFLSTFVLHRRIPRLEHGRMAQISILVSHLGSSPRPLSYRLTPSYSSSSSLTHQEYPAPPPQQHNNNPHHQPSLHPIMHPPLLRRWESLHAAASRRYQRNASIRMLYAEFIISS